MVSARAMTLHLALPLCIFVILMNSTRALGKDIAGIYDCAGLSKWRGVFQPQIDRMVSERILPELTPEGKELIRKTKLEYPCASPWGDPFDYYAHDKTITIPILSVKFLYDLTYSVMWLKSKGYDETNATFYINMLKYREADAFPNSKYPAPLRSLGLPYSESAELKFTNWADAKTFERGFTGALLFVVAHEVAHVVLKHHGNGSVADEVAADLFAIQIMARNQADPAGAMWFFLFASFWVRNGSDFPTPAEYQRYITSEALHPLNGERIALVGGELQAHPEDYLPNLPTSDPRRTLLAEISTQLITMGKRLNSFTGKSDLRFYALHMRPSEIIYNDLAKLAEEWWGVRIDQFPQIAKLGPHEYLELDEPTVPGHKVVKPSKRSDRQRWTPTELDPLAFEFSGEKGLLEISGFLHKTDSQAVVLKALTDRYGAPTRTVKEIGMVTYVWDFDASVLELAPTLFKLFPKNRPK